MSMQPAELRSFVPVANSDVGPIVRRDLFPRMCVRDPYFALEELCTLGAGIVSARVPVEQPLGDEAGPIAAAEAGRHLAILGVCAASRANPERGRFYYLAHRARLRREHGWPNALPPLFADARAALLDKRTAQAQAFLRGVDGAAIFRLDVDYHVISARVFERLYADRRVDMRREPRASPPGGCAAAFPRTTPYGRGPQLDAVEITSDATRLRASMGTIRPEDCKGHFPLYPALPIATLMHALSTACGSLYTRRYSCVPRYAVVDSQVEARELVFSGDSVTVEAEVVGSLSRNGIQSFRAVALIGESRVAGELTLNLAPANAEGLA
jgi:hypothetical protein